MFRHYCIAIILRGNNYPYIQKDHACETSAWIDWVMRSNSSTLKKEIFLVYFGVLEILS